MNRTEHYMVGDHMYVSRGSLSGPATTTAFEIINFYNVEDYEPMCRLLSLQDRAQRIVPQSELRRLT
jgi:hypothetical protein